MSTGNKKTEKKNEMNETKDKKCQSKAWKQWQKKVTHWKTEKKQSINVDIDFYFLSSFSLFVVPCLLGHHENHFHNNDE